jgi:ectoine hydroxylase-related dioxygenase (phytanoyl-CoA dioxygenase family)
MRLHDLNPGFSWKPTGPKLAALSSEQARAFDQRGYLVLPQVLDAATVAEVTAEIERLPVDLSARSMSYVFNLARRSSIIRRLFSTDIVQALLGDLVGANVSLQYDHSLFKDPRSESDMLWHQDGAYPFVEPQQRVVFWFALSDADVEDGCLWMLPGAHTDGVFAHQCLGDTWICFEAPPAGAVPLPVTAGDLVIYTTVMPHHSGANRSATARKAYVAQFVGEDAALLVRAPDGTITRRAITEGLSLRSNGARSPDL